MKAPAPIFLVLLLMAACFAMATAIQPRAITWNQRNASGSVLKAALGESRRLFANQFFVEADVYFHSGYYPSIFDRQQAPKDSKHMVEDEAGEGGARSHEGEAAGEHNETEHEKQMNFLGAPKDWIDRFGRRFRVTRHTHLEHGEEGEILPWLKLSAELDPQRVDTYTVAAYWLRNQLGKVKDAEAFLREGLRNNPDSYEILFELGKLYYQNWNDTTRARNVWELALKKWETVNAKREKPDLYLLDGIAVNLARLEEGEGNYSRAIVLLELASKASPNPAALRQQIEELRQKEAAKLGK